MDDGQITQPDPAGGDQLIIQLAGAAGRLVLVGDLDAASSQLLVESGRQALADGAAALTLDCSALRFCDSAGLGALVRLSGESDGRLTLQGASTSLRKLLEITDLTTAVRLV